MCWLLATDWSNGIEPTNHRRNKAPVVLELQLSLLLCSVETTIVLISLLFRTRNHLAVACMHRAFLSLSLSHQQESVRPVHIFSRLFLSIVTFHNCPFRDWSCLPTGMFLPKFSLTKRIRRMENTFHSIVRWKGWISRRANEYAEQRIWALITTEITDGIRATIMNTEMVVHWSIRHCDG
jgi:hypothetical protein